MWYRDVSFLELWPSCFVTIIMSSEVIVTFDLWPPELNQSIQVDICGKCNDKINKGWLCTVQRWTDSAVAPDSTTVLVTVYNLLSVSQTLASCRIYCILSFAVQSTKFHFMHTYIYYCISAAEVIMSSFNSGLFFSFIFFSFQHWHCFRQSLWFNRCHYYDQCI